MSNLIRRAVCILAVSLAIAAVVGSQQPAEAQVEESEVVGDTLRVATKPLEPFVFIDDEELRGFSVDYWNAVADRMGATTEWVELETVAEVIAAVEGGDVDAGIAGISITAERERTVDFSQPYYNSGQLIATQTSTGASTATTLFNLVKSGTFLVPLLVLIVLIFIVSHLVWFFERGYDDDFPEDYRTGIIEALWWSTVSVITGGEAVKDINRPLSRIIAVFWLLLGLFLLAFVTARATSVLTVAELESDINSLNDLVGKSVSTVEETATVDFLGREAGIAPRQFETLEEALDALQAGDTDAVVFDAPVLSYALNTAYQNDDLRLIEPVLGRDPYGIAVPQGSELLEPLNRAVLEIGRDGTLDDLLVEWFG
jgi:ABC-type amino acid transport substrate-binding protein